MWTRLADEELGRRIVATGAPEPGGQQLTAARKLFARTRRNAGRLKNPDDPRVLRTAAAFVSIRGQCRRRASKCPTICVRRNCCSAPGARFSPRRIPARVALGAALQRIVDECGPEAFEDLIKEAMRHGAILRARWLSHDPAEVLRRSLGLAEGREMRAIEREMAEDGIAPERWSDHRGDSRSRQEV